MDFNLNEDQQMIYDAAREFASSEIEPMAMKLESSHDFPWDGVNKMAEVGFFGLLIPEAYGGTGADYLSYLLVEKEMAKASPSLSMTLGSQVSLTALPIMEFGSEELKQKFLPPLASGEKLGCFALTEPNAGSDPAGMSTTASRDGSNFVINGTKIYITTGSVSKIAMVFAKTGTRPNGKPEISCFIVDRDESPYQNGTIEDKMGIHASPTTELVFDNCVVPEANLLGKVGDGLKMALMTLNTGRLSVASQSIGYAEAAFERARRFVNERQQFGQKIVNFQAVSFRLADCLTELNAAKTLTWQAVNFKERFGLGDPRFISLASQAKLFATQMANKVTSDAIQVHGGYGYMREYRVEEFFRAARLMELVEGTSEIQRLTIARNDIEIRE